MRTNVIVHAFIIHSGERHCISLFGRLSFRRLTLILKYENNLKHLNHFINILDNRPSFDSTIDYFFLSNSLCSNELMNEN